MSENETDYKIWVEDTKEYLLRTFPTGDEAVAYAKQYEAMFKTRPELVVIEVNTITSHTFYWSNTAVDQ